MGGMSMAATKWTPVSYYLPLRGETAADAKPIAGEFPSGRWPTLLVEAIAERMCCDDEEEERVTLVASDGNERSYDVEYEMVKEFYVREVRGAVPPAARGSADAPLRPLDEED